MIERDSDRLIRIERTELQVPGSILVEVAMLLLDAETFDNVRLQR